MATISKIKVGGTTYDLPSGGSGAYLPLDGSDAMEGNIDMDQNSIDNIDTLSSDGMDLNLYGVNGNVNIATTDSSGQSINLDATDLEYCDINLNASEYITLTSANKLITFDGSNGGIFPEQSMNLGINSYRWTNGYFEQAYATNGFYLDSDKRLKNVHGELDLDKAYDLIEKCSTILYDMKADPEHKEQIGMIAQEVKEFFPEIVNENEDGLLSLDYARLTVIILRVLKDLIERVKKLEK